MVKEVRSLLTLFSNRSKYKTILFYICLQKNINIIPQHPDRDRELVIRTDTHHLII